VNAESLHIWSIHTAIANTPVELILVFDSAQQASNFVNSVEECGYQIGNLSLSKLTALAQEHQLRFTLNPEIAWRGEQLYLKEGDHWMLTADQLIKALDAAHTGKIIK
jgi:hypothetical protein